MGLGEVKITLYSGETITVWKDEGTDADRKAYLKKVNDKLASRGAEFRVDEPYFGMLPRVSSGTELFKHKGHIFYRLTEKHKAGRYFFLDKSTYRRAADALIASEKSWREYVKKANTKVFGNIAAADREAELAAEKARQARWSDEYDKLVALHKQKGRSTGILVSRDEFKRIWQQPSAKDYYERIIKQQAINPKKLLSPLVVGAWPKQGGATGPDSKILKKNDPYPAGYSMLGTSSMPRLKNQNEVISFGGWKLFEAEASERIEDPTAWTILYRRQQEFPTYIKVKQFDSGDALIGQPAALRLMMAPSTNSKRVYDTLTLGANGGKVKYVAGSASDWWWPCDGATNTSR